MSFSREVSIFSQPVGQSSLQTSIPSSVQKRMVRFGCLQSPDQFVDFSSHSSWAELHLACGICPCRKCQLSPQGGVVVEVVVWLVWQFWSYWQHLDHRKRHWAWAEWGLLPAIPKQCGCAHASETAWQVSGNAQFPRQDWSAFRQWDSGGAVWHQRSHMFCSKCHQRQHNAGVIPSFHSTPSSLGSGAQHQSKARHRSP